MYLIPSRLSWKAVLLPILAAEVSLFGLYFNLPKLAAIIGNWPAEPGLQLLAEVSFVVGCVALVVGRSRPGAAPQDLPPPLPLVRTCLPSFLVQAVLFLGLMCLTARIQDGGDLYWYYRLRYATGWLLLALATFTFSLAWLVPPRFWQLLHHGLEALVAVALADAIVCIGLLSHPYWDLLNQSTRWGVHGLLSLMYPEVIYQPEKALVGLPSHTILIACPCGGSEGIGLILIFLTVYFWLFRHALQFPAAFLTVPVGVALMWLCNVLRLTMLVVLRTGCAPAVDVEGFHSQAGVAAFLGVSLGMTVLLRRARLFRADEVTRPPTASSRAALAYLSPFLILLAVMMVGRVFAGTLDWTYPARMATVGALLWFSRRQYRELRWTCSWQAVLLGGVVFLLWLALEPVSPAKDSGRSLQEAVAGLPTGWAVVWISCRVLGSVVVVPLAEELAFRGYLLRRLTQADFQGLPPGRYTAFACLISSLLFGVLHDRWLAGTLAGFAYALAVRRRGELSDAVAAHAVTNGLLAAYIVTNGAWSFWT
jgi:exosortase E/protease (VPEID-CTERM system)